MKMKLVLISLGFSCIAYAGSPPKDFMNIEACANVSEASCTLSELLKINFPNAKVTWDRDGKQWIVQIKATDKLTGESTQFSFQLEQEKDSTGRSVVTATRVSTWARNNLTGIVSPVSGDALGIWNNLAMTVFDKTGKKDPLLGKKTQLRTANAEKKTASARQRILNAIRGSYRIYSIADESEQDKKVVLTVDNEKDSTIKFSFICRSQKSTVSHKATSDLQFRFSEESPEDDEWKAFGEFNAENGCKGKIAFESEPSSKKPQVSINGDCCRYPPTYSWLSDNVDVEAIEKENVSLKENDKDEQDRKLAGTKQAMSNLSGKYKNRDDNQGGEFAIELESEESATVEFKKGACRFHHKKFDGIKGTYNLSKYQFKGTYKEGGCSLDLSLGYREKDNTYTLSMDESGNCSNLCGANSENALGLMGNYEKKGGQRATASESSSGFSLPFKIHRR